MTPKVTSEVDESCGLCLGKNTPKDKQQPQHQQLKAQRVWLCRWLFVLSHNLPLPLPHAINPSPPNLGTWSTTSLPTEIGIFKGIQFTINFPKI
jgi:hypothetical protein